MNRNEMRCQERGGRGSNAGRRRRLRPAVMALEGRKLLSTLTVSNTNDSGAGSLRAAVIQANSDHGGDTIVFPSLFNAPRTIALTGGQLELSGTTGTTTITGPGANRLSVSGNQASRVFQIDGGVAASISGLTITDGNSGPNGFGGGLYNKGTLILTACTVSGNTKSSVGGGLCNQAATATLTNCTVSGNFASGRGGGLENFSGTGPATMTLTNCTVSGNTAYFGSGLDTLEGTLTLTNCTVSGNTAQNSYGDALVNDSGTTTLTNSIVSGNTNAVPGGGGDISGNYTGSNNLIGGSPLLAPLGDYGGPTLTYALLPGSPALGGGTSTGAPATDQRGQPRSGRIDIGAFQSQGFILTPVAASTPQSAAAGRAFTNPLAVTVTATNPVEPVDGGIISFAAPAAGPSAVLSAATAVIASGQARVRVTANTTLGSYTVTAAVAGVTATAGFALANSTGTAASVVVVSGSGQTTTVATGFAQPLVAVIEDAFGNPVPGVSVTFNAPEAGASATLTGSPAVTGADGSASVRATANTTLGSYTVTALVAGVATRGSFALANADNPSLVLTTTRDVVDEFDGLTSLREAIAYANSHPGPDTIIFRPAAFGARPRTIRLLGGPLVITDPATTTIVGPGAGRLTLKSDRTRRVFDIRGGTLALSGLTIAGVRANRGGGLRDDRGTLELNRVVIRNNSARG